jgi:hypothetical protein
VSHLRQVFDFRIPDAEVLQLIVRPVLAENARRRAPAPG